MRAMLASIGPLAILFACGGRTSFDATRAQPTLTSATGGQTAGSGGIGSGSGGKDTGGAVGTGGRATGSGGSGTGGRGTGGAIGTGGRTTGGGGIGGGTGGRDAGGAATPDGRASGDGGPGTDAPLDRGSFEARDGSFERGGVERGADRPLAPSDAAIDPGVAPCTDAGGETCAEFCASQPSAGLLVCDDFSTATPDAPRRLLPWNDMPSLTMSVSGSSLVLEDPEGFSACSAQLGPEMDFRDTSIEVTMSAETEVRSLSAVSWGTPANLINAGLQRDEHTLYLHFVVKDVLRARLSSKVLPMAPGQYQRVKMEVRASGLIRCFVDDQLVLETTQDLSGLPRTLAPGLHANAYPPEQRFTFDDFVVRKLDE